MTTIPKKGWKWIAAPILIAVALLHSSATYRTLEFEMADPGMFLLPVEVLGEEGKIVSRTFSIDAATANATTSLWMMVNNLSYQDKASVKVNDGGWISLNHTTVEMPDAERLRGGMVHGGYNTIRVTLPITGIVSGENTLHFRFNESDGISMGYRVIKMNLLSADGSELLSGDFFEDDDPSTWEGPYTDQTSIDEGRDLWYNAELWTHYLPDGENGFWYSQTLPTTKIMKAKCTSCHTQDGRDLEIFSYSNESIIERAKFHKLSEEQGKKIASYIRSLSAEYDNVDRYGRPWNPPYQPGPELRDKPIEQWAAGAGLEAVLEKDRDMLPYLFPNGVNREEVRKVFNSDSMKDRTTLPLAIQLPDWKHWLPIIHPLDAYSKNGYIEDPLREQKPLEGYQTLRTYLEAQPVADRPKNELKQKLRDMWNPFRKFHEEGSASPNHWRTKDGTANMNLGVDVPWELANTSLARLYAVKNFEVVNEFDLQDKAHWWVIESDQPGERQWPISTYSVFEVPAHFTAKNSRNYENQPYETGLYETTAWYNLQFILNGGNGFVGGTTPTDFNYNNPFIGLASQASGIDEPLRYFSSVNYMYQIRTWSQATVPSNKGFRIRFQGPWTMLGMSDSNQRYYDTPETLVLKLDEIVPGLARWVLDAMLWQFVEEVEKYDINTWPRVSPDGGSIELDPSTKSSVDPVTDSRLSFHWADKMYDIIPRAQALGADCEVMDRIIDWSKSAWPLIDFEKFKETCTPETCTPVEINASSIYKIKSKNDKCLSTLVADPQVSQQTCADSDDQKWLLVDAGEGYYYIRNMGSNQYLQSPEVDANGEALEESVFTGGDNQKWNIVLQDNCKYAIASKATSRCMDLFKGLVDDGTKIQQWTCSTGVNQQFDFEFVEEYTEPVIFVSINSLGDVTEGDGNASFEVSLDGGITNTTGSAITGTITWSGSADSGSDYTEVTEFSIANGESSTVVAITIVDDTEVEEAETLIGTLSTVSVGDISATNSATVNISDNDEAVETPVQDGLSISITGGTNAVEGTSDVVFTISLDNETTNTTGSAITGTILWSGSATNDVDYSAASSFSIATGATSTQITATIVDDLIVEPLETITATLSEPAGAAVSTNDAATVSIEDDDEGSLTLSISSAGDVTEGSSDAVFTVSFDGDLVNGLGEVVTGSITLSGTSTKDSDYTDVPTFSIADGEGSVEVVIPILDDALAEGAETLMATIADASVGVISETSSALVTISDNDDSTNSCTEDAITDGAIYHIRTMHGKGLDVTGTALTDGNNVQQWDFSGADNQQWRFEATGDGYYFIRIARSDRSLGVATGSQEPESVGIWDFTGDPTQQWSVSPLSNCRYKISSRSNGHCLDLAAGSDANGTDLQLMACDESGEKQQFTIELMETEDPDELLHETLWTEDLSLYPNPAGSYLWVRVDVESVGAPLQIKVLDLSGKQLIEQTSRETPSMVDLRSLKGGIYIVEIVYNGEKRQRKIRVED